MITEYDQDVKIKYSSKKVEVLDKDTGEIKEETIVNKQRYGDFAFAKIYRRGINILKEAIDSSGFDIFIFLVFYMSANDNTSKLTCEKISKQTGIPERTVTRVIARFKKSGLLVRDGYQNWILCPYVTNRAKDENEPILLKKYKKAQAENSKKKEDVNSGLENRVQSLLQNSVSEGD